MLDLKDKRILYELDKNSRETYSQIAKKVGLSQEAVRYRVNNLVENKVVAKFQTVLDGSKIGFRYYKMFFKLRSVTTQKRNEIIQFLSNDKNVAWVVFVDGNYDLGVTLILTNLLEIQDFLDRFATAFPESTNEKILSINLFGDYLHRDYLLSENKREETYSVGYGKKSATKKLDKNDFNILKELCKDSRKTTLEISKTIDLSQKSVYQRLKLMEKDKIISTYSIVLNNEILGQLNQKVLLYLVNFTKTKQEQLFNFLRHNPRLTYWVKALGSWDIDFEIETKSAEQSRLIIMELLNKFSDIIKNHNVLTIYDLRRYTYLPENYSYSDYISYFS